MKKLLIPLMFLSVMFTACSDDGEPTVEITSPADGSVYTAGDVVNVEITATDDVGVASMDLDFGEEDGTPQNFALDLTPITDKTSFTYTVDLTIDAATPAGEYEVTVTATDADGNEEDDSISITIE